jgi:hypothetical protein
MSDHEKAEEHVEDLEVPDEQSEDVTGGVLIGLLLPAVQKAPAELPAVQRGQKVQPGGLDRFQTGGSH